MAVLIIYFIVQTVFLAAMCGVASYHDVQRRRIPNWIPISLFFGWIALRFVWLELAVYDHIPMSSGDVLYEIMCGVIGCAVVIFLLAGTSLLCKKLTGNDSPLGMGDLKLFATLALYFGPVANITLLLVACLSFAIFVLVRRIAKNTDDNTAPMAPFISLGMVAASVVTFLC